MEKSATEVNKTHGQIDVTNKDTRNNKEMDMQKKALIGSLPYPVKYQRSQQFRAVKLETAHTGCPLRSLS